MYFTTKTAPYSYIILWYNNGTHRLQLNHYTKSLLPITFNTTNGLSNVTSSVYHIQENVPVDEANIQLKS